MVVALTLNWNQLDDTSECISSLLAQGVSDLHIVVVDNGSTDGSPIVLKQRFPEITLLANPINLGTTGGNNVGLRWALAAGAESVFIVNNDTELEPECLSRLQAAIRPPDIGGASPLIVYYSQPGMIWASGGCYNRFTLEQMGERRGQPVPVHWNDRLERDYLTTCGLLIKRSVLEAIGLFDERFFIYYDDSDLCLRARRVGFRLLLTPDARLRHKVSASSGGTDTPRERYLMARGSGLFFRKHTRGLQWLCVLPWRTASAARTSIRLIRRRRWDALRAYWCGLQDGWLGPVDQRLDPSVSVPGRQIINSISLPDR